MGILTPYFGLDGLILILSAITAAYVYMTRNFNYWKKRGVVEVQPTAFIGNFGDCLFLRKSPGQFLKDIYDMGKNTPYVGLFVFDKPFLLLRDPQVIKRVLVKDFNYFNDRYVRVSEEDKLGNSNLFIIKNPDWKTLRAKLSPIFTSLRLKKMFELMVEVGKDLDTYLQTEGLEGVGRSLEMKEICAKFTTDLIGSTAYGLKVNSLNNPDAEFRKCGRKIFTYNIRRAVELTSIFFKPEIVKPLGFKFFEKESTEFLRNVFWNTINQRMESGIKRNDLIDLLIELKKNQENNPEQNGFNFDGDNLVAQAAIFFTAGYETSATTMSFTLYELAKNPDFQKRLRVEILDAIKNNGGEITYNMLVILPYLDSVVSETLRMYPPATFLDRVAMQDYRIPATELIIEKGTPIFIPLYGFHYDPEYFHNPEIYNPERFSEENKKSITPFTYLPFGDGPHVCIGTIIQ
ncbi:cytochrome P450 6k1-like isoform X2 [Belonocnema kinseyi]|uniref:cytochrome P450 6k1-like isoform X2 n=1 Tax=Belonocnema kinseyi TaxID=2817044 RepID=UPI00143D04F0|nr:cytochrome P450 6k1-like isoform X2 [Belonocnema kinseyi]